MKDLRFNYRTQGKNVLIEMELESLLGFFNTFDPSPFYEKDLDPDAEEYIVNAALDINARSPIKLVIYLPPSEAVKEDADAIEKAIHNFFKYKTQAVGRELRLIFQQGRWSLIIGLSVLAVCLELRSIFNNLLNPETPIHEFFQEGLLVSGWVAMWRPFQIFLYDWWPIWQKKSVHQRLSEIEVEIHPNDDRIHP